MAAATAATANGVPDITNGRAWTRELDATLERASKAYAKVADKSSSLPANPTKVGDAAKRLRNLDTSNATAKALSADPTCAAAAETGGATTPADTTA